LLSFKETKDILKALAGAKKKQTLANELLATIDSFKTQLDEFERQIIASLTDISQKAQSQSLIKKERDASSYIKKSKQNTKNFEKHIKPYLTIFYSKNPLGES
ncbi:MAG: hypothetical protein GX971_01170, partial [Firmicutes bacterium]|nr:hypothetical protein [Bacillota bacterium]